MASLFGIDGDLRLVDDHGQASLQRISADPSDQGVACSGDRDDQERLSVDSTTLPDGDSTESSSLHSFLVYTVVAYVFRVRIL